jgi:hypothetical protein
MSFVVSRSNNRRIAAGVAVCYVLASTLSGLWHSHPGDHCDASPIDHSAAQQHANHDGEAAEGCDHDHFPQGGGDCVVCRFVAQSALPGLSAPEPGASELVVEARQVLPSAPPVSILSCSLARAPPAGG